jgi:hypothetical protein
VVLNWTGQGFLVACVYRCFRNLLSVRRA